MGKCQSIYTFLGRAKNRPKKANVGKTSSYKVTKLVDRLILKGLTKKNTKKSQRFQPLTKNDLSKCIGKIHVSC